MPNLYLGTQKVCPVIKVGQTSKWVLTVIATKYVTGVVLATKAKYGTICEGDLDSYDETKVITPDSTASISTTAGNATRKVYNEVASWSISSSCTLFEWLNGAFVKVQTVNPAENNTAQLLTFDRLLSDGTVELSGGVDDGSGGSSD